LSEESSVAGRIRLAVWICDFAFFLSFAIVVTSSVTTAGVLLVFSFLIVPAVIGFIFSRNVGVVLAIAWAVGIAAVSVRIVAAVLAILVVRSIDARQQAKRARRVELASQAWQAGADLGG
jgi:ABC-type Mn2+/Zn2+ transport system permease subunit